MDDADRASLLEQQARERALAEARRQPHEEPLYDDDGVRICIDCWDPIEHARLAAAPRTVRCIDCQSVHETRMRDGLLLG